MTRNWSRNCEKSALPRGDEVELLGKGWLGGAPLSIRLNRTVIALRKGEAALVQVELAE